MPSTQKGTDQATAKVTPQKAQAKTSEPGQSARLKTTVLQSQFVDRMAMQTVHGTRQLTEHGRHYNHGSWLLNDGG